MCCKQTGWAHEVAGMRGIYAHIAPEWHADLVNDLQDCGKVPIRACEHLATTAVALLTIFAD